MVWIWNFQTMFYCVLAYFKPNFNPISYIDEKLWIIKVGKLDVSGRPLFANPVTYKVNQGKPKWVPLKRAGW